MDKDNILKFKIKKPVDKRDVKLVKIADEIDAIVMNYLTDPDVKYQELCAVIAHRFGSLLKICDNKELLWKVCKQVVEEQGEL